MRTLDKGRNCRRMGCWRGIRSFLSCVTSQCLMWSWRTTDRDKLVVRRLVKVYKATVVF